jgi:hypothetical protein
MTVEISEECTVIACASCNSSGIIYLCTIPNCIIIRKKLSYGMCTDMKF